MTQRSTRQKLLSYLSAESLRRGARASSRYRSTASSSRTTSRWTAARSSGELSKMRGEGLLDYRKNKFTLAPGTGGGE